MEQLIVEEQSQHPAGSITLTVDALIQELDAAYTTAISGLESERATLEQESAAILTAADELAVLLPAKAREAQRAADALLGAGKREEAQAKIEEQQRAERAPMELEDRRRTIAGRLAEIDREKRDTARRVFTEWFPELRTALVDEQQEMCSALDTAWEGIQHFANKTGTQEWPRPLVTVSIHSDLTAREQGPERPLFHRLMDWFGGRR